MKLNYKKGPMKSARGRQPKVTRMAQAGGLRGLPHAEASCLKTSGKAKAASSTSAPDAATAHS